MKSVISHLKRKRILLFFITSFLYSVSNSQRPNIIYIMTDDMGYGDLSGYGRKDYSTPNLDKLAAEGIKFLNAYSAGPLCTPTRTAFMTGRYPARTPVGLIEPITASKKDSIYGLTAEYPSVAALMRDAGYETVLIGKWHLGSLERHNPVRNGFDYFYGFRSGAIDYISHKGDGRMHDLYENQSPVYPSGYMTDILAERSISFIKQKHTRPFFLTIMFNAPHWPWQVAGDKPYDDTTNFRNGGSQIIYAGMMKSLDDAVGNIISALDDEKLSRETIVIFTNDNGGERYSEHAGLAKSKGTLWEGGIKVPAFVRWPGKIKAGSITEQPIITMDWTKTILATGGAKSHADFPLDGIDLMPVMTGKKKNTDRIFFWRTFQRIKQKAIMEGHWKYLQDETGEYLFDLSTDIGEKTNLKEKEKDIFDRLKKKFAAWEKTVLQPIPL